MTSNKEFKQTEIGEIPVEWEIKTIDESCFINEEGANPSKDFPDEKFKYIDISNVESGGSGRILDVQEVEGKNAPSRARRVISEGDVIMSTVRPYLKSYAIIPGKYDKEICSTGYAVLSGRKNLKNNFLFYSLLSNQVQDQFNKVMRGANYPALNKSHVSNTFIPVPPLLEQKAIAQKLTVIRNAIEQTQAVIEATEELKKSMMKHLFTYGPVPVDQTDQVELKETDSWHIPADWDLIPLEDICTKRTETIHPKDANNLVYVGLEHINPGEIYLKNSGDPSEVKSSKHKFYDKDVLYGKLRPYLDKSVFVESEGICSTDIYVFKQNKERIVDKFLVNLLHTQTFLQHSIKTMSGVNHPRTSWNKLRSFKVPLPNKETQKRIVLILETIETKMESEIDKKIYLEKTFQSTLESLMTAKIRVN